MPPLETLYALVTFATGSKGFQVSPETVRGYMEASRRIVPETIGAFGSPWTEQSLADATQHVSQSLAQQPSLMRTGPGAVPWETPGLELSSLVDYAL